MGDACFRCGVWRLGDLPFYSGQPSLLFSQVASCHRSPIRGFFFFSRLPSTACMLIRSPRPMPANPDARCAQTREWKSRIQDNVVGGTVNQFITMAEYNAHELAKELSVPVTEVEEWKEVFKYGGVFFFFRCCALCRRVAVWVRLRCCGLLLGVEDRRSPIVDHGSCVVAAFCPSLSIHADPLRGSPAAACG